RTISANLKFKTSVRADLKREGNTLFKGNPSLGFITNLKEEFRITSRRITMLQARKYKNDEEELIQIAQTISYLRENFIALRKVFCPFPVPEIFSKRAYTSHLNRMMLCYATYSSIVNRFSTIIKILDVLGTYCPQSHTY
ncbi:hypothetical protein L9F63_020787, partial [Diploptera punctata]